MRSLHLTSVAGLRTIPTGGDMAMFGACSMPHGLQGFLPHLAGYVGGHQHSSECARSTKALSSFGVVASFYGIACSPPNRPSEQIAVVQDAGCNSSNAKGDYQSEKVGHDLFAVEELQSRIDDHGKDDVVEESPEDR